MNVALLCVAPLLLGLSSSQAKLSITVNGKKLGSAEFNQDVTATSITHRIKLTISVQGRILTDEYVSINDKAGRPVRETHRQVAGPQSVLTTSIYGAKEVKVSETRNGKTTTRKVSIPKGNLADPSNYWFVNIRPRPSTTATYLSFNESNMEWKSHTSKYIGDETVPGTKIKGHHIHHEEADEWLDDRAMPIRVELRTGGATLVMLR